MRYSSDMNGKQAFIGELSKRLTDGQREAKITF